MHRVLVILVIPLLTGCASTISVDRIEVLLAYAEARAAYAVSWDRVSRRCEANGWKDRDCVYAAQVNAEAGAVDDTIQSAVRRQDQLDLAAVIRFLAKLAKYAVVP